MHEDLCRELKLFVTSLQISVGNLGMMMLMELHYHDNHAFVILDWWWIFIWVDHPVDGLLARYQRFFIVQVLCFSGKLTGK